MKKINNKNVVFIIIAFILMSLNSFSKEKILDLKDTYYNCGERNFSVTFKSFDNNFSVFGGVFITIPDTVNSGFGLVTLDKNLYKMTLSEITNSCKVFYVNNYKFDQQTGVASYDTLQSFEIIKIEDLPKPQIEQIGNKLVSNVEGPHRWYLDSYFSNDYEDTPNNEYIPKISRNYQAVAINPDFDCISLESNRINFIISSVEDDIKYSNSQKFNINNNQLTFFEINELSELKSVELYNILGEKIDLNVGQINLDNNKLSIDFDKNFENLPFGFYVVLAIDNNNKTHKFSIVK